MFVFVFHPWFGGILFNPLKYYKTGGSVNSHISILIATQETPMIYVFLTSLNQVGLSVYSYQVGCQNGPNSVPCPSLWQLIGTAFTTTFSSLCTPQGYYFFISKSLFSMTITQFYFGSLFVIVRIFLQASKLYLELPHMCNDCVSSFYEAIPTFCSLKVGRSNPLFTANIAISNYLELPSKTCLTLISGLSREQ